MPIPNQDYPSKEDRFKLLQRELESFRGKPYGNAFEALVEQFGSNGEVGTFVCFVVCKGEKPAILSNADSDPDPAAARKLVRKLMRYLPRGTQ